MEARCSSRDAGVGRELGAGHRCFAGEDAIEADFADDLAALPVEVQQIADNYNHLHEQPTVFYALAIYSHLVGVADPLNSRWHGPSGLRVVHSLSQCTVNFVPVRFAVFSLSSLVLMVITIRNVVALAASG